MTRYSRFFASFLLAPALLGACAVDAVDAEPIDTETTANVAQAAQIAPGGGLDGPGGGGGGGGSSCFTNTGTQPSTTVTYKCDATAKDIFGRPLVGKRVELVSTWSASESSSKQLGIAVGTTDAQGRVHLELSSRVANGVSCTVDPGGITYAYAGGASGGKHVCHGQTVPAQTFTASRTEWARFDDRFPVSARTTPLPGASYYDDPSEDHSNAADGVAHLYQSGAYDKVLVVAEPFDPDENTRENRGRIGMQREFRALFEKIGPLGWDVWIVQPGSTGDSAHKQAANLARAIKRASERGGTGCGKTVTVFGFSMGGIVSRIALARWETDQSFRDANGLSGAPPVNLYLSGDSPHNGANLNPELQNLVWENKGGAFVHDANLDSCAARQMLRLHQSTSSVRATDEGFRQFQIEGKEVVTYLNGNQRFVCEKGPAVKDLFPKTMRTVAFSHGQLNVGNQCYTVASGRDVADGHDVCYQAPRRPYSPAQGDTLFRIVQNLSALPGSWYPDWYINARRDDIAGGSRHDRLFSSGTHQYGVKIFGEGWMEQRFAHTFMPASSVFDMQIPLGDNDFAWKRTRFNRVIENDLQGFHSRIYPALVEKLITEELEPAGNLCSILSSPVHFDPIRIF